MGSSNSKRPHSTGGRETNQKPLPAKVHGENPYLSGLKEQGKIITAEIRGMFRGFGAIVPSHGR